jgi:leader peptidase (prepilin peptidase)/N-methyltransferase
MIEAIEALPPTVLGAFGAGLGAIVGSYMGALALRWPRGETTIGGRSTCDFCERQLQWFELVPLVSFLILRGRCQSCNAPIDRVQPMAEWSGALLCGAGFALFPVATAVAWSVLILLLLPLALLDARHLWLPDRLILLLAACGILLGGLTSAGTELLLRLSGAFGAFIVFELVRRLFLSLRGKEGMGSGDPKLLAAMALWIPPFDLPLLILIAATLGIAAAALSAILGKNNLAMPFGTLLSVALVIMAVIRQLL